MTDSGGQAESPTLSRAHSTARLLDRVRAGDDGARDELVKRYLPLLRRWGHGRLPAAARGVLETEDLVQVTLIKALEHVENIEAAREGALLAYLRRALLNAVRDELRRSMRQPRREPVDENLPDPGPGTLDRVIGQETYEKFESVLATLGEQQQEAVILRLEFGFSFAEVAAAIGSPSANAARMMVSRALVSIAEAMSRHR